MTGDRYYLDQLNAQATFAILKDYSPSRQNGLGLVANGLDQVRQQAWSLRQIDEVAWANPDGSAEKAYFSQIAANNWHWLVTQLPTWTAQEGQAYGHIPGTYSSSGLSMAPWQQDYFASTVIAAAKRGEGDQLLPRTGRVRSLNGPWSGSRGIRPGHGREGCAQAMDDGGS